MDRYDFAELRSSAGLVSLECTDSATLQALLDGLKKNFPNLKTTPHAVNDEVYGYEMKGFGGKDVEVAWFLIKQLCSKAWEPVGAVSYNPGGSANSEDQLIYQFKLKSGSK
jgi:hypothetical protein